MPVPPRRPPQPGPWLAAPLKLPCLSSGAWVSAASATPSPRNLARSALRRSAFGVAWASCRLPRLDCGCQLFGAAGLARWLLWTAALTRCDVSRAGHWPCPPHGVADRVTVEPRVSPGMPVSPYAARGRRPRLERCGLRSDARRGGSTRLRCGDLLGCPLACHRTSRSACPPHEGSRIVPRSSRPSARAHPARSLLHRVCIAARGANPQGGGVVVAVHLGEPGFRSSRRASVGVTGRTLGDRWSTLENAPRRLAECLIWRWA